MLEELERKRAELMREVHAVGAAIKRTRKQLVMGTLVWLREGRTPSWARSALCPPRPES